MLDLLSISAHLGRHVLNILLYGQKGEVAWLTVRSYPAPPCYVFFKYEPPLCIGGLHPHQEAPGNMTNALEGNSTESENEGDSLPRHMQEKIKKYDLEMSLPPERVQLVDRAFLADTLEATAEQTNDAKESTAAGKRGKCDIDIGVRPRFSSACLEDLTRSE